MREGGREREREREGGSRRRGERCVLIIVWLQVAGLVGRRLEQAFSHQLLQSQPTSEQRGESCHTLSPLFLPLLPSSLSPFSDARVQRPVRIMLDRNEDMLSSGGRHPYLGRYRVGFTSEGRVTALDMQLFGNGGISEDLSIGVGQLWVCVTPASVHLDK